jgi:quinol monooxygenase YgiN
MHLLLARLAVLPGKRAAFLAYAERIRDMVTSQAGFRAEVFLNARGYPSRYTYATVWETRAELLASLRSPALEEINAQEHAAELYTLLSPLEVFQHVLAVPGPATGQDLQVYAILEWTIPLGGQDAFLALRRQAAETLAQAGPGMGPYHVWQLLAEPERYRVSFPFTSDAELTASLSTSAYREWAAAHSLLEGALTVTRLTTDIVRITVPAPAGVR